jgi:hypothetical protein
MAYPVPLLLKGTHKSNNSARKDNFQQLYLFLSILAAFSTPHVGL